MNTKNRDCQLVAYHLIVKALYVHFWSAVFKPSDSRAYVSNSWHTNDECPRPPQFIMVEREWHIPSGCADYTRNLNLQRGTGYSHEAVLVFLEVSTAQHLCRRQRKAPKNPGNWKSLQLWGVCLRSDRKALVILENRISVCLRDTMDFHQEHRIPEVGILVGDSLPPLCKWRLTGPGPKHVCQKY